MSTNFSTSRPGPKPKPGTRLNLIEAGVQVLNAVGYTASGVQEILALAEVPKGSFYYHFESKEHFGVEVINAQSDRSIARLRSTLGDEGMPPRERLIADFKQRGSDYERSGFRRGCLFGNLSLEIADHSDTMRESLKAHFHQWRDLIEACVFAAQMDGSIRNPTHASKLAEFTLSAWEGALLRSRTEKNAEALTVFQDVIFSSVLV
ncbi:TetR family transcriptional regulator C-terminal domain-containing protein [Pseudomonas tolaasii]|uniref:TetR/AcrR family transcriptional regulator n=1 Tax=Pseudomonas tolaasii TaxID=29442 RepID=UPI001C580757|nr:TetR/AcrR family transcriptional regulator [Pseudomonas tolaasii]MBW1248767.1 TetR family transcriptional regulator C-terminal domain-containing protein [Pseudomonas tolaasii]